MLAVLCCSVCLSVASRSSNKTAKHKITDKDNASTIPQGPGTRSSFLMPKIAAKFDRGNRKWVHQMQARKVKIVDFRKITHYIPKTV